MFFIVNKDNDLYSKIINLDKIISFYAQQNGESPQEGDGCGNFNIKFELFGDVTVGVGYDYKDQRDKDYQWLLNYFHVVSSDDVIQ